MSFPRSISFLLASLALGGAAACAGAPTADTTPVGATSEAVQGDHPELEAKDATMQEVEKHGRQRRDALEAAREAAAEAGDDKGAGGEAEPADDKGGHGKP